MAIFYPRKQTLIITVISALAVAGVAYYVHTTNPSSNTNSAALAIDSATSTNILDASLKNISADWKSQFLETTTPAIDVKNSKSVAPTTDDQTTLTGQFSKNFFARYMLLKQDDLQDDQDSVNNVVNQSLLDLAQSAPQPKNYTSKDIVVSKADDATSIRAYADAVGTLFNANTPSGDPATIAGDALNNNNPKGLSDINGIVKDYQNILTGLLKMPVPAPMAIYHVDLINGVSSMMFISEGMNKVFSDPAQGLVALNIYGSAQDSLHSALLEFKSAFNQNGMAFAQNEPGYFFSTIQ